jgi:ion channel-forming bestrophin family protein
MWVEPRKSWMWMVLFGGGALPRIWARVLATTAFAILVTLVHLRVREVHINLTPAPFTMIGLPLGIFLGFRNTSAYDRFWEARKLWGSLVNTTRTLTRQVLTLLDADSDIPQAAATLARFQHAYVHSVAAYVHILRMHLRDQTITAGDEIKLDTNAFELASKAFNPPLAVLQDLGMRLRAARLAKYIDPLHVPLVEGSLTQLTDIQGACERIKGTPVPFSYTVLMHRIVAAYCILLPLGIGDSVGWATPVVVMFVSYALFGLDAIGEELEQPFGLDRSDLPLSALSRNIEITLRSCLAEKDLPKPLKPRKGILS